MTDVRTDHPSGLPYIELTEQGRKIAFRRDCLGEVKIYRQVNQGEAELLVKQIRTPYTDTEDFPPGTTLTYTLELGYNRQQHTYVLEARV